MGAISTDEAMIIVDNLVTYPKCKLPYKTLCHMMTDDLTPAGLNGGELHTMASMIGLKRSWFQDHPAIPHYDLTPSKRTLAIKMGALEIDGKEMFSRGGASRRRVLESGKSEFMSIVVVQGELEL